MNLLSSLIFSMMIDSCPSNIRYNKECYYPAIEESNKYELIHIYDGNRIPYRTFNDYIYVEYKLELNE